MVGHPVDPVAMQYMSIFSLIPMSFFLGTAADIGKKALSLLPQRLADTGVKIIGPGHDEIILEVPEKMAGEVAVIL
ncbi:MAG: hypothetical protein ABSG91_15060, partial [Syntrophobacteraceae bacterium]